MMFWSHQIVAATGFLTYTQVATKGDWQLSSPFFMALALVMVGAALPDIDHPESTLGKRVKFLSYPISAIFGHRGFTYSLVLIACLYALGVYMNWDWMFWLTVGVALHLVGDYLTDSGLPLLWPIRTRYRFVLVGSSNGISEPVMVTLFICGCAALIWAF